ncbi:ABC transporter ATP-binding protein [Catellatospora sp. TT07R-123]|uniref:ABC transporter ATP-binding protein n=1 Tax=Catellatospora sp. TT07R-123 TaxID=2733863 RepID=UPI001B0DA639|nr:ABC transporter ATP-binding protein [Catellatospora sp. TT07R-123]GHJ43399.1 ABC transporter ATP-binding protein [Catellatospora sp. TT07R-123]
MTALPQQSATLFAAARAACRFGPVHAVREATCTIRAGQQTALTGVSGSGKSTLLHLIAGLQAPTSGGISWPDLGGDPRRDHTAVAIIFQAPSLIDALDVRQNVALPLLLSGSAPDPAARAADAALRSLGLTQLAARLPVELSSGQAQRVAIARALAMAPKLILADEPTGHLDHDTAVQVVATLRETATATGAALLIATHDRDIAAQLPHRWHIDDGNLCTEPGSRTAGDGL